MGCTATSTATWPTTILEEAGQLRQRGDRAAEPRRRRGRRGPQGRRGHHAAGLEGGLPRWTEAGWNALPGPVDYGGQGLPTLLQLGLRRDVERRLAWPSARPAADHGRHRGAGRARHGRAEGALSRQARLRRVDGTMNLTEPQAGSDLGALRTRAERGGDGTYRITGQKIFITYGEHDLTDNIVHLVLARLPDAPPGTRGISLFLVPKFLSTPTARWARNDVRCVGIEHKLGIHASPTCTMVYRRRGRRDRLAGRRGEPRPRLHVHDDEQRPPRASASRASAIAERAYQQALAYASERRQGRAPGAAGDGMSPIVEHPDVRRMLLTMQALTEAARAICYHDRRGARPRAPRADAETARKAAARARVAADARRQGLLHRHRRRGRLARRAGPWRHGLHRGDRRGAAPARRPHRRRSTRAPTASRPSTSSRRKLPLSGGDAVRARRSPRCARP